MEYCVGDKVVVPGCGVGLLEAREEMQMEGVGRLDVYRVNLGESAGTTWIPVAAATTDRIRPVMSSDAVPATWEVMSAQEAPEKRATWNRRQRRYNELISSGAPQDLAALAGELAAVQAVKTLSFGEVRLLEKARKLLVDEIAVALGQVAEEVDARFEARVIAFGA